MGSSQSTPGSDNNNNHGDGQPANARRIVGAGNAINPQSGQPMRHHKHLYLVLGNPKIRYTGHPGRGPLMFHTVHYIGDGKDDSVESLEGFPLVGSVVMRPEPPSLIPSLSTAHHASPTASIKFSLDVSPECSRMNPLTVEAFVASSVKFDADAAVAGRGAFVVHRPSLAGGSNNNEGNGNGSSLNRHGSSSTHHRPVSPFNTTGGGSGSAGGLLAGGSNESALNGRVFSQVITEGGKRMNFSSCEIPISTLKSVTETKKAEGRHLPVEGCIIFRLSWKAKKIRSKKDQSSNNNKNENNNTNNNGTTTTDQTPSSGDHDENSNNNNNNNTEEQQPQLPQIQQGTSQMLLFWEIPDPTKLHAAQKPSTVESENTNYNSSSNNNSSNNKKQQQVVNKEDIVRLKPFTSRFLFTSDAVEGHQNAIFRVDDVYDLAGDDDIGPSPERANNAGENNNNANDGENDNNNGDNENNNNATDGTTTAASVAVNDDDDANAGNECVVCLTNPKNALLLPCRHLCLCTDCAPMLRQQQNKCPVCRRAIEKVLAVG